MVEGNRDVQRPDSITDCLGVQLREMNPCKRDLQKGTEDICIFLCSLGAWLPPLPRLMDDVGAVPTNQQ